MQAAASIVLVRHAAVDCASAGALLLCGWHDAHLSAEGRWQVECLRMRLAVDNNFAAVYTSPLRRALDTAAAVPPSLLPRIQPLKSLREIHCGDVEGLSIAVVQRQYQASWEQNNAQADPEFRWPGGETYRAFRQRVLRVFNALARKHRGERILVVSHAGVVNQILGHLVGQSAARWENYRPGNASISEILWHGDGTGRVIRFDDRRHLEPGD
jgi:broad specificity phosphatase PhoE